MVDAISLEVFKNLFISVCEEMGVGRSSVPPTRPTLRSGGTSPAPSLIPRAILWHRLPTCPSTWGPCRRR